MTRLGLRGALVRAARIVGLAGGVALIWFGTLYALGGHTAKVKENLNPTSAAPTAHGKAHLTIKSSKKGKFKVLATHLQGGKTFDVIVRGTKVGVIQTSSGGNGKALFSTTPGSKGALLGFDPRGTTLIVREQDDGDDVLVGDMGQDPEDAGEVACCVPDDGEVECDNMTATECTAEGGTVGMAAGTTATSCLPDPCATTPPPGGSIVCCTNATGDDESEAECEVVSTEAECADNDGIAVQAASCNPNPCLVTPPTNTAACCLNQDGDSQTDCEVLSAEACMAAGGAIGMEAGTTAATCSNDPCSGSGAGGGGNSQT
jgi:hypothetical protein